MSGPEPDPADTLHGAIAELERTAESLRSGDVEPAEAAELVERCAELAARVGAELERSSRAAAEPEPSEQETLL